MDAWCYSRRSDRNNQFGLATMIHEIGKGTTKPDKRPIMAAELRALADRLESGREIPWGFICQIYYESAPVVSCFRWSNGFPVVQAIGAMTLLQHKLVSMAREDRLD